MSFPVLFVAHGAPMVAFGGEKAESLKQWGASLPRPKGILIFSAHWETVGLQMNVDQSWKLAKDILVGEASFTSS